MMAENGRLLVGVYTAKEAMVCLEKQACLSNPVLCIRWQGFPVSCLAYGMTLGNQHAGD